MEGTLLPAIFLKMVENTIVVASGDPGIPSFISGVVHGNERPAVYNSVQMCVYHFEAKAEECVCMVGGLRF